MFKKERNKTWKIKEKKEREIKKRKGKGKERNEKKVNTSKQSQKICQELNALGMSGRATSNCNRYQQQYVFYLPAGVLKSVVLPTLHHQCTSGKEPCHHGKPHQSYTAPSLAQRAD